MYIQEYARTLGLHVSMWSPGDGITRYRFYYEESDYNAGMEIKTVLGRKDAALFLDGVKVGKGMV